MRKLYSRREFLGAAVAAGVLPMLPGWVRAPSVFRSGSSPKHACSK